MTCPAVVEVVLPGPPGPAGSSVIDMVGPAVLGRAESTLGPAVGLPLGGGLSIVGGALTATGATDLSYDPLTRLLISSTGADVTLPLVSTTAAGLIPHTWLTGVEAATLPHIHGALAGPVYEHVRNASGAVMPALTPYHVVGNHGDTDTVTIVPADSSDPQTMPASGITMTELAANGTAANGHGVIAGVPTGVNTVANSSGTVLYVGSGVLTPTPPAANVQAIAIVGRSHATTGTLAMLPGPALARVAFTGDYSHLANKPTLGSAAAQDASAFAPAAQGVSNGNSHDHSGGDGAQIAYGSLLGLPTLGGAAALNVGTTAGTVAAGDAPATAIAALKAEINPLPQYLQPSEVVAGAGVTIDTTTMPNSVIVNAASIVDGLIVIASGSTYTCDIRASNRFLLAAAVNGNITINCTNLADLTVSSPTFKYVEFQLDFFYTAGIVTIQGAGFTTKWDGNTAAVPTVNEFEQLIVQITPAITGTPFTTPTVKIAPMRGNT